MGKDTLWGTEFVGPISQTKADPDPRSQTEGEILLTFISSEDENVAKARVVLGREDYEKACDAHRQGRPVKFTGRLVSSGRVRTIVGAGLEVLG